MAEEELANIFTPSSGYNPKEIVYDYVEAFEENDQDKLKEILASSYKVVDLDPIYSRYQDKHDELGIDILTRAKAMQKALPKFSLKVVEVVWEGSTVVAVMNLDGTMKGTFLGVKPDGQHVSMKIVSIFTIRDGKITEIQEMWNEYSVMKQIGYIAL